MCFFLNLQIAVQNPRGDIQALLTELAARYTLHLLGTFPNFQVTEGHCSCRLVLAEGRAVKPIAFLTELVQAPAIKHLKVGWTWAGGQNLAMKPDTAEVRLPFQEFASRNEAEELIPDIWYRLHDPEKYLW